MFWERASKAGRRTMDTRPVATQTMGHTDLHSGVLAFPRRVPRVLRAIEVSGRRGGVVAPGLLCTFCSVSCGKHLTTAYIKIAKNAVQFGGARTRSVREVVADTSASNVENNVEFLIEWRVGSCKLWCQAMWFPKANTIKTGKHTASNPWVLDRVVRPVYKGKLSRRRACSLTASSARNTHAYPAFTPEYAPERNDHRIVGGRGGHPNRRKPAKFLPATFVPETLQTKSISVHRARTLRRTSRQYRGKRNNRETDTPYRINRNVQDDIGRLIDVGLD